MCARIPTFKVLNKRHVLCYIGENSVADGHERCCHFSLPGRSTAPDSVTEGYPVRGWCRSKITRVCGHSRCARGGGKRWSDRRIHRFALQKLDVGQVNRR